MASTHSAGSQVEYPTRDGRLMGETPLHAGILWTSVLVLKEWCAGDPMTYVSGNMMMYYVPGDKYKHVSPDVFVTRGISRDKTRDYYLVWEEGKAPDLVLEITSKSTRREDLKVKHALYRDVLKVVEYFLFDPRAEYLKPPLQGYRLTENQYVRITPVDGRLPSETLSLALEAHGNELRFFDPAIGQWLPTKDEKLARVEAQNEQLRREIESLRRRLAGES